MKRFISILLSLILAVSSCVITAAAETDYHDPAVSPAEPVISPRLTPELHSKLTPALLEAIEAAAPCDTEQVLTDLLAVVYFDADMDSIDDMPSWPDSAATGEYAAYVPEHNQQLAKVAFNVTSLFSVQSISYQLPGCIIIDDVNLDELMLLERNDLIRSIDVFDNARWVGKLDRNTRIAMNVYTPDDYIPVWVGNAAHMKTVAEMPSWPAGRSLNREEALEQMSKARGEYSAYEKAFNDAFVAEAFDGIDAVVYDGYGFMVLAAVKIGDLERLAARDCVRYIEFYEDPICVPDVDDDPICEPALTYGKWKLCEQYGITDADHLYYQVLVVHPSDHSVDPAARGWELVQAFRFDLDYATALYSAVVGGRRLTASDLGWNPFKFSYGVYDAQEDRYFDLTEIDFGDYEGLYEVWKDLELTTPYGRIYEDNEEFSGDADGDGMVTVMDATHIQRSLAGLCTKHEIVAASADVDHDGEITVLDATRIQRYKANICNLDGTPLDPDRGEYLFYPD